MPACRLGVVLLLTTLTLPSSVVSNCAASKVAYEPHGKAWIKDKINAHFVKQVQDRS